MATVPEHGGPPGRRRANPFDGELARANSAYASFVGGVLVQEPSGEPVTPLEEFVHDSLRVLVLNPRFSCVGAKAAASGSMARKSPNRKGRASSS